MKLKRILALLLVFVLVLSTFTACSKTKEETTDGTAATVAPTAAADTSSDASTTEAAATAAPESSLPPMTTDNITLKLAFWGQQEKGEVEARDAQIAAFEKAYPNIKVEFVMIDQATWADGLTTLAATGDLPDVFGVFSVTDAIMNQWALNVTDYVANDPDTKEIYPYAIDNARINGKLYCMPWVMFPEIAIVNKTLFEKYNEPLPSFDWTVDDYKAIAKRMAHPEDFNFGTSEPYYQDYYYALYDGLSQRGWDGTNYVFNQTWIDATNQRYEWTDDNTLEWESAEDKLKWLGAEDAWPPAFGRSAMHMDRTWQISYFEDAVTKQSGCEFLYYPQPAGPSGKQLAIIDYSIISNSTKYPREAWELQKWTTWGKQAVLSRSEGYRKAGMTAVSRMPVIDNQEAWDSVKTFTTREDILKTYDHINNIIPTCGSVAPGWTLFDQWCTENDIWGQLDRREVTPEEMADTMTQKANELKDQWLADMPQY